MKFNHIVLMKFRSSVSEEEISRLFDALAALKVKIPGILEFSGVSYLPLPHLGQQAHIMVQGAYSSSEGFNKGFTHAFSITFASEEARDSYIPHPEHELVKQMLIGMIEDVIGFDYARSD